MRIRRTAPAGTGHCCENLGFLGNCHHYRWDGGLPVDRRTDAEGPGEESPDPIQLHSAAGQGGRDHPTPSSVNKFGRNRLAMAVGKISADLALTAAFNAPAVHVCLDSFPTAISNRGIGFCGAQLMSVAPWYASATVRNGATFDCDRQLVRHLGWYLEGRTLAEDVETAVAGLPWRRFASSSLTLS